MASTKSKPAKSGKASSSRAAAPPGPAPKLRWWPWAIGLFALAYVTFQVYGPALNGPFLFDDIYLPMNRPNPPAEWQKWIIGVRPLLSLSFWVNWRNSGADTFSYHLFNVLFHLANGLLVFAIVRRLARMAGGPLGEPDRLDLFAAFAAAIFLLHPVQTEAVAYIASRSEGLSVLFYFAAYAVFLYRPPGPVSWGRSAAILVLFGAAISVKEHTITLPALLLLTDYFWNPGFSTQGIRRNWRLYVPVAAGALAGVVLVGRLVRTSDSAGFGLKDFTWSQYFFTECRAFFVYLRLFLFPSGQTIDYDFPISRTILDHGAVAGLAAIAALLAAAVWFRKRYPLAAFGLLVFVILLAPTSSFVPIKDPVAERRLYLPMIGLLLVLTELLLRWKVRRAVLLAGMGVIAAVLAGASYARNQVWSAATALWEDAVAKTPANARAHFQLAYAYYQQNRCEQAVAEYGTVARLQPPDYRLLVDWALAYDCLNRTGEALAKLEQAAAQEATAHVYALIGMMHAKQGDPRRAHAALDRAQKLDPNFDMTYFYRGNLLMQAGDRAGAAGEYRRALALNPRNQAAIDALAAAEARR